MTITRLEEKAELGPNDPYLAEVERNLLPVIAELEFQKNTTAGRGVSGRASYRG
jgi:hypothetical protein